MTKKELIESLAFMNDDDEIYIAYPSGDYWGSVITKEINDVSTQKITYSEYHSANKLVDDELIEKGYYEEDELDEVVVLS